MALLAVLLLSQPSAHAEIEARYTSPGYNGTNPWVISQPLQIGTSFGNQMLEYGLLYVGPGHSVSLPHDSIWLGQFSRRTLQQAKGHLRVDGSVSSGAEIQIGRGGLDSTLVVASGGYLATEWGFVGTAMEGALGSGTAHIDGSGKWDAGRTLDVGHEGTGTLRITNGAWVWSDEGNVGRTAQSLGKVVITGQNSGWHVGHETGADLRIGVQGAGEVYLENSGLLNVHSLSIGPRGVLYLFGGRLRFDKYSRSGTLGFVSGILQLGGHRVLGSDPAIFDIFGAMPLIQPNQELGIEGNATVSTHVNVAGTLRTPMTLTVGGVGDGHIALFASGQLWSNDANVGNLGGAGVVTVDGVDAVWTNSGDLDVGHDWFGSLSVSFGGKVNVGDLLTIGSFGTVGGDGKIVGDVKNSGLLSPGRQFSHTMHLDGDYFQSVEGRLLIELASPSAYDQLLVTGDATLAGRLNVVLHNGYVPEPGQSFTILTADEIDGFFTPAFSSLPLGLGFDVSYNTNSVVLTFKAALPGDFDVNGVVDGADFLAWQRGVSPAPLSTDDLGLWRENFGKSLLSSAAVPEPSVGWLILTAIGAASARRKRTALLP